METTTIMSWDEYWNSIKEEYCREETHDIDISTVPCIKPITIQTPSVEDILELLNRGQNDGGNKI